MPRPRVGLRHPPCTARGYGDRTHRQGIPSVGILHDHQGVALSRLVLLKDVWDKNFDTNTNVVDVYVNYLRNKIDRDFEVKLIRHDCRDGVYHGGTVKSGKEEG